MGSKDDDGKKALKGLKSRLSGLRQSLHTVAVAPDPSEAGEGASGEQGRDADVVESLDYRITILDGSRAGEIFDVGRIITFGRAENCEVRLSDIAVSREHFRVVYHPEKRAFLLQDLGSQNGVELNGRTTRRAELASGDRLRVGNAQFLFHRGETPPEAARELLARGVEVRSTPSPHGSAPRVPPGETQKVPAEGAPDDTESATAAQLGTADEGGPTRVEAPPASVEEAPETEAPETEAAGPQIAPDVDSFEPGPDLFEAADAAQADELNGDPTAVTPSPYLSDEASAAAPEPAQSAPRPQAGESAPDVVLDTPAGADTEEPGRSPVPGPRPGSLGDAAEAKFHAPDLFAGRHGRTELDADTERVSAKREAEARPEKPPEEEDTLRRSRRSDGGSLIVVAAFFLAGAAVAFAWYLLRVGF